MLKNKNNLTQRNQKIIMIETTHTETTLTQEAKEMNIEKLNRIMSEKKTRLPSLRNQNWKTIKAETKKKKNYSHISQ